MNILLTGANGMVGQWLCQKLSPSQHNILATGRRESIVNRSYLNNNFKYEKLEITNPGAVNALVNRFEPALIIHCAAITQVDDCELNKSLCYSINVDGTALLLAAAEQRNARFCFLSTDFVFSGNEGPYKEDDLRAPVNYYGKTKQLAEELISQSTVSWSIARTILLYGKTLEISRSNFMYWVKDNLSAARPIKVVSDQVRTPTYLPDLVNGIMLLIEKEAEGIYHLSGKDTLSPFQMAVAVANHLDLDASLIDPVNASSFTQVGARPLRTGFIIEKAERELGYAPTPFLDTLTPLF